MKLVLVHGRAPHEQSGVALQRLWIAALKAGFQAAGVAAPDDLEIVFPYYGDLIFPLTEVAFRALLKLRLEQGLDATTPPADEQRFVQDIVLEMALCKGLSIAQLGREAGASIERGVLNWRVVMVALRLLGRVARVDSAWLDLFIHDAWRYFTQQAVRLSVQQLVQQAIPHDEVCVVVAHSFGSIVAYDVLMERMERGHIKAFITLGSPLGVGAIMERLPTTAQARRAPEDVGAWFNVRDEGDLVALHDVPAVLFKGHPTVKNYSKVHNNSVNQHGIQDYLRDAVVARAICTAIGTG